MPTKVIMPELGEAVVEGTVSRWLKAVGDAVEEYDALLEVNTDKVDTEIPSPATGTVLKILVEENTVVQAGSILCWIGEPGEAVPGDGVLTHVDHPAPAEEPVAGAPAPSGAPPPTAPAAPPVGPAAPGRDGALGFISPVVARLAGEHGVDLRQVPGTGMSGRITKKDVLAYVESRKAAPAPAGIKPAPTSLPDIASAPAQPGTVQPLTPIRRSIAEHMVRSKRTSPHVTTIMEADLNQVVKHRAAQKAAFARDGAKLTFTPYFVSAVVNALKAYPIVNSSWTDKGVLIRPEINIGVAAAIDDGLIVPVLKHADSLSLLGLARSVNDLANRARTGQLKPDEVTGGTFTITNHGVSGSLFATPIISQPQCAILGVGMIQKRVTVIDDAIAIRPMVYLGLTFDHRILDGAVADHFLSVIVKTLEGWK